MQRMRSKSKKCDWMKNWFLWEMPISLEPLNRISWNLERKYFMK